MASGVDAGKEEGGDLRNHLVVRQSGARLIVLALEQEVCEGPLAGASLDGLHVMQHLPHHALFSAPPSPAQTSRPLTHGFLQTSHRASDIGLRQVRTTLP